MFKGKEYVYEVYKERSISKAAQKLYISQPALSATIKKIEEKIGAPVFDRSVSPLGLTECGVEYIKYAEMIMDIENSFESYLNDLNHLRTGKLNIGSTILFASFVLPPVITEFKTRYPLIKVELSEANTAELEKNLVIGNLDIIIDNYDFKNPSFKKHLFLKETLILAVHKKFESNNRVKQYQLTYIDILAGKHLESTTPAVDLHNFQYEPFIILKPDNDTRIRTDKICENIGLKLNVILELSQLATAYNIACSGMGLTFISDTIVTRAKPDHDILFYKIDGSQINRDVYIFSKSTKYKTQAMKEFINLASSFQEFRR